MCTAHVHNAELMLLLSANHYPIYVVLYHVLLYTLYAIQQTGAGNALAQVQVDKQSVKGTGAAGFFLWRSVYLSKQVSWRNRALVRYCCIAYTTLFHAARTLSLQFAHCSGIVLYIRSKFYDIVLYTRSSICVRCLQLLELLTFMILLHLQCCDILYHIMNSVDWLKTRVFGRDIVRW
jgi:hypothetical protein